MGNREWLSFTEEISADVYPSAAIKEVLSTDYESEEVDSGTTRIVYRLNGAWLDEDSYSKEEYVLMELPEAGFVTQEGRPMLIREGIFAALPNNADFAGIHLLSVSEKELDGEYNILPVPKPILEHEQAEYIADEEVYGSDNPYPTEVVEYFETADIMGVKCAHIFVNPVLYKPLSKKITVNTKIEFEVKYNFTDSPEDSKKNSEISSPLYASMLLGYTSPVTDAPGRSKPRLLIVTTDDLQFSVRVYEGVKTHRYNVEVVCVDEICAKNPGLYIVEAIKVYLMEEHNKAPLGYVLLAGDTDKIPTPLYDNGNRGKVAYENYYCSAHNSVIPLFPLSRIPASTRDDLFTQLNIATYYFRHEGPVRKNVCLTTDGSVSDFKVCKEVIATAIGGTFNVIKRFDKESTKEELISTIESGVGFLNFRGHGSNVSWGGSIGFKQPTVRALNVGNNTPHVFSIACNTAAIHIKECFGATWMRNYKAVSFLGASMPSYRHVNSNFDRHLWEALSKEGLRAVGDVFKWATLTLYRNGASSSYVIRNIKIYLQLGDPTADYKEVRDE